MSLTETHRHLLCGYWFCTADSRSVVKVAIPHLRGKWSPTKAILRIFAVSFRWNPLVAMLSASFIVRLLPGIDLKAASNLSRFVGSQRFTYDSRFVVVQTGPTKSEPKPAE